MRLVLALMVGTLAFVSGEVFAQNQNQANARFLAGAAFENGRKAGTLAAEIGPGICIPAWQLAGDVAIRLPEAIAMSSPGISERNASAIWRHWWMVHYASTGGPQQAVPVPQIEANARALSQALNAGNIIFFEILGACWIGVLDREIGNGDLFLRSYLVERKVLPDNYVVSVQARADRTKTLGTHEFRNALSPPKIVNREEASTELLRRCDASGGIPASPINGSVRARMDGITEWEWTLKCERF